MTGLDVVAVGIANHRGSVVAWNRSTGMPLCNVMLWSDNRTAAAVDRYTRTHGKYRFQGVCGLPFSPLFSAFKIRWLIDHNDLVAKACADGTCCFGTVDSWLLWNLTGGPAGGFDDRSAGSFAFGDTRQRRRCANAHVRLSVYVNFLPRQPSVARKSDIEHPTRTRLTTDNID